MTERDARTLLATLAGKQSAECEREYDGRPSGEYHDRLERAIAATDGLAMASEFLAECDLDDLERAVERAAGDLSARAADGRAALDTLRSLQCAAEGVVADGGNEAETTTGAGEERSAEACGPDAGGERQFQSGRSSPLGSDDIAAGR